MNASRKLKKINKAIKALAMVEHEVPELRDMKMDFSQAKVDLSLIGRIVKAN